MSKFLTKQTEVDAYMFDGTLKSACEIALALSAIELDYDKNGLGSQDRMPGPVVTVVCDFTGTVTLVEGDWVVQYPDGGALRSWKDDEFIAKFEEAPVG